MQAREIGLVTLRHAESGTVCYSVPRDELVVAQSEGSFLRVYSNILRDTGDIKTRLISTSVKSKDCRNYGTMGVCISADGERVLATESSCNRVQEFDLRTGVFIRSVGERELYKPFLVGCSMQHIAVASMFPVCTISLFAWKSGHLKHSFSSARDVAATAGSLGLVPTSLRMSVSDQSVLVAQAYDRRISVFTIHGNFVRTFGGKRHHITSYWSVQAIKRDGRVLPWPGNATDLCLNLLHNPSLLWVHPDKDTTLCLGSERLFLFRNRELRLTWLSIVFRVSITKSKPTEAPLKRVCVF